MKISAIICEFNPLHTGHAKLINFAKSITDKVVCIMSGNYTQRGLPACASKFDRAKHAILAGADLVIELPITFATGSAEDFAFGAIEVAHQIKADYLIFGSECGNISTLSQTAEKLLTKETNTKIKQLMQEGVSYPKAMSILLGDIVDKPNNTLAIEYIKAILKKGYSITPLTITREDNYNNSIANQYASSSALRSDKSLRDKYTYDFVYQDINDEIELKYKEFLPSYISTLNIEYLKQIYGVTEGIENRIVNSDTSSYELMLNSIKTKRYTRAKIQRILLNAVLNVKTTDIEEAKLGIPFLKTLAVEQNSLQLIPKQENHFDEITARGDRLFVSLGGKTPLSKLQIISRK